MNFRQLRYFCEIVEAGSAAAAAARLHVAPTALSMQLGQLEGQLGGELFDRSRRPMELTALGRYFHPRARMLLAQTMHLEEETRAVAAGESGVLAIGYTRSTIFSILPDAIRAFRCGRSKVKVEIISMLSEHQHAALQSGRIQVGVSRYLGPVQPIDGLEFRHLLDDPFVVALPASHPLAKRKSLRPNDLASLRLITYPKDPQSRFAEHTVTLLSASGGKFPVADEADDIHTALGMVASDLGYCLVGRSVSRGSRADLVFLPLPEVKDQAAVFAVTKAGESSMVVAAFVDALYWTTGRSQGAGTRGLARQSMQQGHDASAYRGC